MPLPDNAVRRRGGRHRRGRRPATAPQGNTAPVQLSRRAVLRGTAGAGAAGLALTALASPALAATAGASVHTAMPGADHVPDHVADGEAVVVHVLDVRSGEMDVYRGTSYTRVQDRALAARLARTASASQ